MLSFKQFLVKPQTISEGKITAADIFKRDNKKSFIDKAIKGELLDVTGNKIPKIPENSDLITFLNATNVADREVNEKIKSAFGKSLTALAIDKNLNGFSKGGSGEPSGGEWEKIICCAYNMLSKNVDREAAIKLAKIDKWKPAFNHHLPIGLEIVKSTFGNTPKGVMEHYGESTANLTKEWDSYFISTTGKPATGPTRTPKTDMYIGSQHISLKKAGGSQLMSGGKAEALATLAFAYESIPKKIKENAFVKSWNSLTNQIEKDFINMNLPSGKTIKSIKKEIELNVKDKIVDSVRIAIDKHDEMTKTLREILSQPEVNKAIIFEAMTGKNKFKEKLPVASHMMKFSSDYSRGNYEIIDERLIDKYASKTTFNISFKTSGAGKATWTALKGIVSEEKIMNESYFPDIDNLIEESYEETNQELITEGISSRIGGSLRKGMDFLKSFVTRMLSKLWEKIKSIIIDSLEGFQKLFKIRIDINNPHIVW